MPEVIEVTFIKNYIKNKILNKTIDKVSITGGKYLKNGIGLTKANLPLKVIDIYSKGKFMWFELLNELSDETIWLTATFGLSGYFGFVKNKWSSLEFKIGDVTMYYTDKLGFGLVKVVGKANLDKKLNTLEDDVLLDFTDEAFALKLNMINKKHGSWQIAKVLLEQELGKGVFSGIGNYLSAEIMYRAKLNPQTTISKICANLALVKELGIAIRYVVKSAYLYNVTSYLKEFEGELDILRKVMVVHKDVICDKFEYMVYGKDMDSLNNPVEKIKLVQGRTTYWCPKAQIL
jgi:formamidopyrimidine-DNA glycosylase